MGCSSSIESTATLVSPLELKRAFTGRGSTDSEVLYPESILTSRVCESILTPRGCHLEVSVHKRGSSQIKKETPKSTEASVKKPKTLALDPSILAKVSDELTSRIEVDEQLGPYFCRMSSYKLNGHNSFLVNSLLSEKDDYLMEMGKPMDLRTIHFRVMRDKGFSLAKWDVFMTEFEASLRAFPQDISEEIVLRTRSRLQSLSHHFRPLEPEELGLPKVVPPLPSVVVPPVVPPLALGPVQAEAVKIYHPAVETQAVLAAVPATAAPAAAAAAAPAVAATAVPVPVPLSKAPKAPTTPKSTSFKRRVVAVSISRSNLSPFRAPRSPTSSTLAPKSGMGSKTNSYLLLSASSGPESPSHARAPTAPTPTKPGMGSKTNSYLLLSALGGRDSPVRMRPLHLGTGRALSRDLSFSISPSGNSISKKAILPPIKLDMPSAVESSA
jgi:hypothetical protein